MERYTDLTREQQIDLYNRLTEQKWDLTDQLGAIDYERALVMNALKNQVERGNDAVGGALQGIECQGLSE